MAIRNWESKSAKGTVQQEGFFDTKWVIYKDKFFGDEKIGSVEPKEDKLREFLEERFGKPVKIWWQLGLFLFPSFSLPFHNLIDHKLT